VTWNPFDWTAGPFLTLYATLAVIVFLAGFSLRSMIGPAAHAVRQLTVLELACLAGGARRLGDAVLLSLISAKGATIAFKGDNITVTDQRPLASLMNRPPVLPVRPNMTRAQFQKAVEPLLERVQGRLQALGYYPSEEQMTSFRLTILPLIAFLLVFGTIKVVVGTERHHPVGFLIVLLVLTVVAGFFIARSPARTRAGKDALQAYQADNARASRAPLEHELLLALALSGAVVLSDTAYASVYAASKTMNGSGDGGSGCGGGGGGGGCGGCSA
jgi:uncharacterized protein (TIGR04222 family)